MGSRGVAGLFVPCSTAGYRGSVPAVPDHACMLVASLSACSLLPPSPPTARTTLAEQKGEAALQPWNTSYSLAGDVEKARAGWMAQRMHARLAWRALASLSARQAGVLGPKHSCLHAHCLPCAITTLPCRRRWTRTCRLPTRWTCGRGRSPLSASTTEAQR